MPDEISNNPILDLDITTRYWFASLPSAYRHVSNSPFDNGIKFPQNIGTYALTFGVGLLFGKINKDFESNHYVHKIVNLFKTCIASYNISHGIGLAKENHEVLNHLNALAFGYIIGNAGKEEKKDSVDPARTNEVLSKYSHDSFLKLLDSTIAGQTKAKEQMAQAITMYMNRQKMEQVDERGCKILLLGPTGTGKTSLGKAVQKATGLPMITIDSSRLVNEGFKGTTLNCYLSRLKQLANNDKFLMERSIICFDEFDKLFINNGQTNNKVASEVLKMLEGADIEIGSVAQDDSIFLAGGGNINTSRMIFILSGAFTDVGKGKKGVEGITNERLIELGLTPEAVGRITDIIELQPLNQNDYHSVLNLENGTMSINNWQKEFKTVNAKLVIDPEVLQVIVEHAINEKLGVRGLDFLMKQLLKPKYSELLSQTSSQTNVTEEVELQLVHVTMKDWLETSFAKTQIARKSYPSLIELQQALNKRVIGQTEAKKIISEAVYFHLLRQSIGANVPKSNILMVGPSGCGKTYMLDVINQETGLPVAILDASKLTRKGMFEGNKPEDALAMLLEQTNGDIGLASKGIVFFDEFDKQLEDFKSLGDGVQNQLLRMLQGDEIKVSYKGKEVVIDTKEILFVFGGAFSKFPQLYQGQKISDDALLTCGIRPEFLGRIGHVVKLNKLTAKDLRSYLLDMNEQSPLAHWKQLFEKVGSQLVLTDPEINKLVEDAAKNPMGVRSLDKSLRELLLPRLVELLQVQ
jgi:ATP-dependent Clp protease ATP-binding subunit ClpX